VILLHCELHPCIKMPCLGSGLENLVALKCSGPQNGSDACGLTPGCTYGIDTGCRNLVCNELSKPDCNLSLGCFVSPIINTCINTYAFNMSIETDEACQRLACELGYPCYQKGDCFLSYSSQFEKETRNYDSSVCGLGETAPGYGWGSVLLTVTILVCWRCGLSPLLRLRSDRRPWVRAR
jgi:hypothetical protein